MTRDPEPKREVGLESIRGTPHWMAPEVIRGEGHGVAADIWSLGCTFIEIGSGEAPWSQLSNVFASMYKIAHSEETPALPAAFSESLKNLLRCCFMRQPAERPSASALLQQPFLAGGG